MVVEPSLIGFILDYALNLPSEALAGNVFAVSILLILFYLVVVVINKLTDIIILLLKKVILLVIVSLAFYQFLQLFAEKMQAEGLTTDTLIFGGVGLIVGSMVLLIAVQGIAVHEIKVQGAFPSVRKFRPRKKAAEVGEHPSGEEVKKPPAKILSVKALREDKKLGVVIAYLIVAEFGVISSKTVAAPNVNVGVGFFIVFMIAALFFIRQSYRDFKTGLRHFIVVFLLGGILSFILGYFWGGHPLNELLSETYFLSDSMVAFITGIAVSLFMGSR
jgi:hypothetical protein